MKNVEIWLKENSVEVCSEGFKIEWKKAKVFDLRNKADMAGERRRVNNLKGMRRKVRIFIYKKKVVAETSKFEMVWSTPIIFDITDGSSKEEARKRAPKNRKYASKKKKGTKNKRELEKIEGKYVHCAKTLIKVVNKQRKKDKLNKRGQKNLKYRTGLDLLNSAKTVQALCKSDKYSLLEIRKVVNWALKTGKMPYSIVALRERAKGSENSKFDVLFHEWQNYVDYDEGAIIIK